MVQVHKRFSDEQVAFFVHAYSRGLMRRLEVEDTLDIGKTRFFALWKQYQAAPETFSIAYNRSAAKRMLPETETAIERELLREKNLIDDPEIPISGYNYSALRDRLRKQGIGVSVNTIIDRARKLGCHQPRRKRKTHDREVLTASIGALIQHDGSTHRWSPFASEKWTLITSIDDYSRMILFADFFPLRPPGPISGPPRRWSTPLACRCAITSTPCVFSALCREGRASLDCPSTCACAPGAGRTGWCNHVLETDDVDTQWRKMKRLLGVDVTFALPPQAKGKVERPTDGCRTGSSAPAP